MAGQQRESGRVGGPVGAPEVNGPVKSWFSHWRTVVPNVVTWPRRYRDQPGRC